MTYVFYSNHINKVKSLVSIAKKNKELKTFKKFVKYLEVNRIVFKSKHLSTGNSLPGDNFEQELLSKHDANISSFNVEKLNLSSIYTEFEKDSNSVSDRLFITLEFYKPLVHQLYYFFNLL